MRSGWIDPEDSDPNRRTAKQVAGHRAYCPLRWCLRRHRERSQITAEHIVTADMLRGLHDNAAIGFSPDCDPTPVSERHYGPSTGPTSTARRQHVAAYKFAAAWQMLAPATRPVIRSVVLRNVAIGPTARALSLTPAQCTDLLLAGLNALAAHFSIRSVAA
jgi:hypothetical protein